MGILRSAVHKQTSVMWELLEESEVVRTGDGRDVYARRGWIKIYGVRGKTYPVDADTFLESYDISEAEAALIRKANHHE